MNFFYREKEADMERRFELLNKELRKLLAIDGQFLCILSLIITFFFIFLDFQKTEAQKQQEKLLLDELVKIVNKRDELVQHLDTQEKA